MTTRSTMTTHYNIQYAWAWYTITNTSTHFSIYSHNTEASSKYIYYIIVLLRDRANISRIAFEGKIRLNSDFARSLRVRYISRDFEVSRSVYRHGPRLGTADAKATVPAIAYTLTLLCCVFLLTGMHFNFYIVR